MIFGNSGLELHSEGWKVEPQSMSQKNLDLIILPDSNFKCALFFLNRVWMEVHYRAVKLKSFISFSTFEC